MTGISEKMDPNIEILEESDEIKMKKIFDKTVT